MSSHLGLIMLLVRDMPRCKAFYTELLGFEIVKEFSSPDDDFIFLHARAGGPNLALQSVNTETYGVPVPVGYGAVVPGFAVEDADTVYRDWQSKSVEILGEVVDIGAGRMFAARDPEGNYIQIYHLYPQVLEAQKQMGLV